MFQTKDLQQSKHAFYFQKLSSENRAVYENMFKILCSRNRPQMATY